MGAFFMSNNTDANGTLCAAALVHTHAAVGSFRESGLKSDIVGGSEALSYSGKTHWKVFRN